MTDDLLRPDGAAFPVPADAAPPAAADLPPAAPAAGVDAGSVPLTPLPTDSADAPLPGGEAVGDLMAESDAAGGAAVTDAPADSADAEAGPARRRTLAFAAAAVVGVVVVGAMLVAGWNSASAGAGTVEPGAAPVLGPASAPILVEIWADYQCPYCGALTHVLEPSLQRDYVDSGKARVVFRDFSFLGQESTEAAAAARCAGQQDAYWLFHDLLFASQKGENQGAFVPANLISLARYAGLDTAAFATCMTDQAVRTAVEAETAAGRALGVESTPTLRIVGPAGTQMVKGLSTLAAVDAAITQALTGAAPSVAPGASGSPSDAPASSPAGSPASGAPSPSAAPSGSTAP